MNMNNQLLANIKVSGGDTRKHTYACVEHHSI